MRRREEVASCVVEHISVHGKPSPMNSVCDQDEWDAMETVQPGFYKLIQFGIASEAEQLPRGTSGDAKKRS